MFSVDVIDRKQTNTEGVGVWISLNGSYRKIFRNIKGAINDLQS